MTKVLIFENDDVFAGQLRAGLGALGCTVQVFKEGTPGLQAASKANPEIILLTVELPRVNGFSICNKLKKDPKLSSVPLLLLSSRSTQETFEQHKKLKTRADAYLHKPISVSDVIDEMRQFVSLSTLDAAGYDIADEHTSQVDDDEVVLLDDHDDLEIQTLASKSGKALSRHDDHRKTTEMDAVRVDAPPVGSNAPTPGPGPDERFMPQYGLSEDDDNEGETQIASRSAMEEAAIAARIGPPPKRAVSHGGAPPATKPSSPPTPPPASMPPPAEPQGDYATNKRALQHALRELSVAKRKAAEVEEIRAELQSVAADNARLERELANAKSRRSIPPPATTEDILSLREKLHAKDKELVDLRDAITAKDREVIETRENLLALERELAELRGTLADQEAALDESKSLVQALTADKQLSDKRAEDFKEGARKMAEQLNQRAQELRDHHESHQKTVAALKAEHKEALEALETKQREELSRVEKGHQEQLERREAEKKQALESQRKQAAEALAAEQKKAAAALTKAVDDALLEHEEIRKALEAKVTELEGWLSDAESREKSLATDKDKLAKELDTAREQLERATTDAAKANERLNKQREQALAAQKKEHDKALAAQKREHDKALAAAEKEHRRALGKVQDELEGRDAELTELKKKVEELEKASSAEQRAKLEALRKEHEAQLETLQKEHAEALRQAGYELRNKLLEKEKSFEMVKQQLDADLEEANVELSKLRERLDQATSGSDAERKRLIDELEATSAERDQVREELLELEDQVNELEQHHADELQGLKEERDALQDQVNDLAKKLSEREKETDELAKELEKEKEKLVKARGRWGEDRHALEKARRSLQEVAEQLGLAAQRELDKSDPPADG